MNNPWMKPLIGAWLLAGSLNAAADGMKLGYVNAMRVYSESRAAQQIETNLQKEFARQKHKVDAMQSENQHIHQRLANAGSLNASERQQLENQLAHNRAAISKFVEEYNLRRNEEFASLQQNANRIVQGIAKQEQFDIIVQEAVFVRAPYDITDRVIHMLDAGK